MEGQANFTSVSKNNAVYQSLTLDGAGIDNKIERLPFTIRLARSEEDIQKAVSIRYSAYARHVPNFAERLKEPEPNDFEDGVSVLLAESKLDGRPLGTMRLQTNLFSPLALESSVMLPDRFKSSVLAEATRLGVTQERVGRVVTTFLFKAYYMHCLNAGIDWMIITARSPMDKRYEALLMEDVFPGRGYIPMSHVGNIPHRVLALDIATVKDRWANVDHPLYDLYCLTNHPDIDVDHANNLPQFLHDFKYISAGTKDFRVS